jgi:hypothetical protein
MIATRPEDPRHRLKELFPYGVGHVLSYRPWDLAVLAWWPREHMTVVARSEVGAVYYVTGKAGHYVALRDGSIFYAGSALHGLEALLHATRQAMFWDEVEEILSSGVE